jgi:hypothetical protein
VEPLRGAENLKEVAAASADSVPPSSSHHCWNTSVALGPEDVRRLSEMSVNLPVATFTFGSVLVTAVLCGAQPVRHAGTSNLLQTLNDASHATPCKRALRAPSLLLSFQMALAVMLLVAAGLVTRRDVTSSGGS